MHILYRGIVCSADRSFLRLAEEEYTTLPNDVSPNDTHPVLIYLIAAHTSCVFIRFS